MQITSVGLYSPTSADEFVMANEKQATLSKDFNGPTDNDDNFPFTAAKIFSSWITSSAKRSKFNLKYLRGEKEIHDQIGIIVGNNVPNEVENKDNSDVPNIETQQKDFMNRESLKTAIVHICTKWYSRFSYFRRNLKQFLADVGYLWVRSLLHLL